jgi:hypothetical protein
MRTTAGRYGEMSDSEKLVNCGECVHLQDGHYTDMGNMLVCASDARCSGKLLGGPHNCPHFAPSPLARIADNAAISSEIAMLRLSLEAVSIMPTATAEQKNEIASAVQEAMQALVVRMRPCD